MAKDPAFLFYTGDFSTGTQFFTDEQLGKYLRLLMAQHQHGHLTENQVLFICKSYDDAIFSKLVKDSEGLFFNERLEIEVNKRKAFSESRRKNKEGKTKEPEIISKSYDNHMEDRNKDKIEIKTKKGKGGSGEKPKKKLHDETLLIPDEFKPLWQEWLNYRKDKGKKPYAGIKWEQIAVNKFIELSGNNIETAKLIVLQTIQNNWEGLFQLKTPIQNGTTTNESGFKTVSNEFAERLAKGLQSQQLP